MRPVHWIAVSAAAVLAVIVLVSPGLLILPEEELHSHPDDGAGGRWACPMLCVVLEHAGLCPVCGMDLEEIGISEGSVTLSAAERHLTGLTLVRVDSVRLHTRTRLPGTVTGIETSRAVLTAWTAGRIDRFSAPATGEQINAGSTVAWIYSPELIEAQHDLLYSLRMDSAGGTLSEGAGYRLRQLGASSRIIDQVASSGNVMESLPVVSGYSGTVTARHVESGDWVRQGQVLVELADLDEVWIETQLLEGQAGLLRAGDQVAVLPNSGTGPFSAEVTHLDPFFDPASRTLTARMQAVHSSAEIIPGELVQIVHRSEVGGSDEADLAVPASCVLSLGERHIVYTLSTDTSGTPTTVRMPSPALGVSLEPRAVETGPLAYTEDGERYYPVLSGLEAGEIVAADGAFLIDSQAELTGLPSLMKQPER